MIQCRWIGIIDDYFRAQAPRAQVHLRLTCCETQLSAPPSASRYNYAYAVRRRWRDEWRAVADVRAWARGHTWITCTLIPRFQGRSRCIRTPWRCSKPFAIPGFFGLILLQNRFQTPGPESPICTRAPALTSLLLYLVYHLKLWLSLRWIHVLTLSQTAYQSVEQ